MEAEEHARVIDVAARMREIREAVRSGSISSSRVESERERSGSLAAAPGHLAGNEGRHTEQLTTVDGRWVGTPQVEVSSLRNRARAISKGSAFREFDFPSSIPLAGPLITAFRRTLNGISTRWYVRHVMHQQTQINVDLANLLDDSFRLLAEQGQRINAMQGALDDVIAELQESRRREALFERKLAESVAGPQVVDASPGDTAR